MKGKSVLFLMILFVVANTFGTASAQFPIKIPKINKPKPEQPKSDQPQPDSPNTSGDSSSQSSPKKSDGAVGYMPKPKPNGVPVLLKDTFEIKTYRGNSYWKTPNERDHSSWIPLIRFDLFYDQSETVRYTIEWLKPDGTLWFSQPVDGTQTRYDGEIFDTKSTDVAGIYGFRLLNTKTKEVVLQGKFTVKKMLLIPDDPKQKNNATFYTDNDWILPYGFVGFEDNASWEKDPEPTVFLWFKGALDRKDLEARLFHNNQQIASTDDQGSSIEESSLGGEQRNADSCFRQPEVCGYRLWGFTWKMSVESFNQAATAGSYVRYENTLYTKDKPGEYTVKVFYKGAQVREAKFSVQPNGWLETNKFAAQMPMKNYRALIPVKVVGTLDKYNPAAWKAESFYGNPLNGFVAP